jgi:hypothetical protein
MKIEKPHILKIKDIKTLTSKIVPRMKVMPTSLGIVLFRIRDELAIYNT